MVFTPKIPPFIPPLVRGDKEGSVLSPCVPINLHERLSSLLMQPSVYGSSTTHRVESPDFIGTRMSENIISSLYYHVLPLAFCFLLTFHYSLITYHCSSMAERQGFEPWVRFYPHNRLAGGCLRPARPPLLKQCLY